VDHEHDHERSAEVSNRVKAFVATLEREGIATEAQLDEMVESFLLASRPENGYAIVARAWTDPDFKVRLLANANAAIAESGVDLSQWASVEMRVVENTAENHNLIVCTLCSCYPIALLGPSPSWYKSLEYRARAVRDPRGVLSEFGFEIAPERSITVWDSTADARYMVLPMRPAGTEDYTEAQLAALVTRNGLIGTAPL
jgi:nitrile hydratase